MWHCVVTVCRGSQSDCKVHLFVDEVNWLTWRLIGRRVRKERGEESEGGEHHGGEPPSCYGKMHTYGLLQHTYRSR